MFVGRVKNIKTRLEQKAHTEMSTTNPGVNDVLCGKGNAVASHEGNIHFRSLIERHVVGYDSTPNSGVKRDLVERVRQGVRDANGRFLVERRDSPMYEEQSEGKVTKKIQQAFRDKIKSLNKSSGGLRSSIGSATTAPTSNMSRVHQADNAQIPHELSIPGMAYNQGRGLRSSLDSTTTTSSLNTRPTNNTMSRVQPVGNTQIPHELNTSSWMPYDQGNSSDSMYGAEPSLPFDRRSSASMLAMRGSGSRNLSTETTERSDGMQERYPRAPCSLSDNAHADMRRGSRNLVLSAGDGRNLEPEGVVEGAGRTQYSLLLPQRNLEPPQCYDGAQLTREELLRVIQLLGSSKSMDMSVSEEKAQYPRLLMKLAKSNTSFHDLTESLKEIAVDGDEMFSLDAASLESLKQMMWRSNDSMLGDQSMRSILSQGEQPSQKAEV
jgi:hypothetical protein